MPALCPLRSPLGMLAAGAALVLLTVSGAPGAALRQDEVGPGMFLVAPPHAADPAFAATVVLLVRADSSGTFGLVINRRTSVALSSLFPAEKAARGEKNFAYAGGPVQPQTVWVLYRTAKPPGDADHVFGDVYLLATHGGLMKALASHPKAQSFHAYLGYTGWAPGQLEHEMDLDVWRLVPADADLVFAADPSTVWPSLIEKTEQRLVQASWPSRALWKCP